MTAEKATEMNGQSPTASSKTKSSRKTSTPKAAVRRRAKSAVAASKRSSAVGTRRGAKATARTSLSTASRLLSRGKKAAGNAYEWAAEGAGRALPLAVRSMPDQRMVQKLVDERPYMLGAIGLGIGAMIGLMLPSPLGKVASASRPARSGTRGRR